MKRIITLIIGTLLILVGIAGLFLPILQGMALIFLGLAMISPVLAGRLKRRFFKKEALRLKEWEKHGIEAGFTTKRFPLLLHKTDELLDAVNQQKLTSRLSERRNHAKFVLLNQVHGDAVAVLEDEGQFSKDGFFHFKERDAAITNIPELTLLVLTADCLSVFFFAGAWVGLAHAGWRGSEKKITPKTLQRLLEKSTVQPEEVRVIFGPSICARHYEVGDTFKTIFPASSLMMKKGKLHFDLAKENKRQLIEAGLPAKNISDQNICPFCENENFYSFRKEKESAGRTISFITKLV